jgi:hypothetical protein
MATPARTLTHRHGSLDQGAEGVCDGTETVARAEKEPASN